jgi:acetyltransferase-like isoleucine patch superfamily enzyme
MSFFNKLKFIRRLMDDPDMDALYRDLKEGRLRPGADEVERAARKWEEFFYFHSWEYGVAQGMKIGRNPKIEPFVVFTGFDKIMIGDDFVAGSFSTIRAVDAPIRIGNKVLLGPMTAVIGANHGYDDLRVPIQDQPQISGPVVIADNVWIGTGAMIMPGLVVGEGAVVAAGAVVTNSVPPRTVVAGCPAEIIKER